MPALLALLLAAMFAQPAAQRAGAEQVGGLSPLVLTPGTLSDPLREHAGVLRGGPDRVGLLPWDPAAFEPVESLYSETGLVPETYWMRVSVRSAADTPERWILPLLFDYATAVLVRSDGTREVSRTGLSVPLAEQTLPRAGAPSIRFLLAAREEVTLFVRVRHSPTSYGSSTDLRAVDSVTLAQTDRRSGIWNGLLLGVLFALAVYHLFLSVSLRDRTYLYYVAFLLGTAAYWADGWGYVEAFVWPPSRVAPFQVRFYGLIAAAVAYVQFARVFLRASERAPRLDLTLRAVMALWSIAILFGLLQQWPTAFNICAAAAALLLASTFSTAVWSYRSGYRPAFVYLVATAQFVVVGTIYALGFLFAPTPLDRLRPLLQASMLIEALGLAIALAIRAQARSAEAQNGPPEHAASGSPGLAAGPEPWRGADA